MAVSNGVFSHVVSPCRVTNTGEEMRDPSNPNDEYIDLGPQYQVGLLHMVMHKDLECHATPFFYAKSISSWVRITRHSDIPE